MATDRRITERLNLTALTAADLDQISAGTFFYPDSPRLPGVAQVEWRLFRNVFDIKKNIETGGSMSASYRVSAFHPVLVDHFPGEPVFPGLYLTDQLLQMTGLLVGMHGIRGLGLARGSGETKFLKPAAPTDTQIDFHITGTSFKPNPRMTSLTADGYWEVDGVKAGSVSGMKVVVVPPET